MISPPLFSHIPNWLGAYHPGQLTPNHPHFHYYLAPQDDNQPVTLYITDDNQQPRPLRMFYNIDSEEHAPLIEPDTSGIKDFSYLDSAEKEEHERITVSRDAVTHDSSWVVKYEPVTFFDLLTDELINRNVLTWLKSWDQIVFHKKAKKIESVPALFKKGGFKGSYTGFHQDFSYKKLILLAGPPGCGKTTLARVLARHCGYSCQEINASDDRSGKSLISKIDNLVSNKTIRKDQKPTCIIIDEVDGALDSDSNGLKEVLHYLETGHITPEARRQKAEKGISKGKETKETTKFSKDKYAKAPKIQKKQETTPNEERKTKIDRPIIFICNDPFVKGLKQLRSKAIVVYFQTLRQERVVKRLKQISEREQVYIQTDLLTRISQMCNNDVRSSVGVLELVVKMKRQQNIAAKDIISKMRFSFNKDVNASTNEFLAKVMQTQNKLANEKDLFKNYLYYLSQHENKGLLNTTFFHNLLNHKQIFLKMDATAGLYREIVQADVIERQGYAFHHELDEFAVFPYLFYRLKFKAEQHKKIEFPSVFFERLSKEKINRNLLEKVMKGLPPSLLPFINSRKLLQEYLYIFWLVMQTSSTREQDVLKCVYKMLTYGIKLANRFSPNLFIPQFEQLLTYSAAKPEITLSNTSRNLMQQNYEFLKLKSQLAGDAILDNSKQNLQNVINQLKKNRKRKRDSLHGIVKYKYLEGTGTEIKYDLKIGYFFEQKTAE